MNESPFEQSTLEQSTLESGAAPASTPLTSTPLASTPLSMGEGVEVRYPAAQRVLVPGALVLSAIVVPIVLFFVLQPPMNFILPAVIALMELSTAGFMWFLFNAAFVRADASGVTKSQMGRTKTVRWEEIAAMEMRQIANGPKQIVLKNASGREVLVVSDLGDRANGAKLTRYITDKLEK